MNEGRYEMSLALPNVRKVHEVPLIFLTARLLMNRHLYGPSHGPASPEALPGREKTDRNNWGDFDATSLELNIINNNLYIHTNTFVQNTPRGGE